MADYYDDYDLNIAAQLAADALLVDLQSPASIVSSEFGAEYAGTAITRTGLEISIAHASPALLGSVPSTVNGVPVTVRLVSRSNQDLFAIGDRIETNYGGWAKRGIRISGWGPDYLSNKVSVNLENYSNTAGQRLIGTYGADEIYVPAASTSAAGAGRTSDTPPWYGGDYIYRSGGAFCTSWFSVKSTVNGRYYGFTAGHCGGTTWYTNGQTYGTVSGRAFGNLNLDAQAMPVSSNAGLMWADPYFTTRRVTSRSSSDPVGGIIATDGYTDREVGNVRIDQPYYTTCYNGQCTHNSVRAHQLDRRAAFSPGDSGGPVITGLPGGAAEARGMVIAYEIGSPWVGYYTPINTIINYYHLALLLG